MKNFSEFIKTIDVDQFGKEVSEDINEQKLIINTSNLNDVVLSESFMMTLKLLRKYHEWLNS
jgi:hypothetical protein